MITKCWIIADNAESAMAVKTIENNFPCFTMIELLDSGEIEFTVRCREYDITAIQNIINPFV